MRWCFCSRNISMGRLEETVLMCLEESIRSILGNSGVFDKPRLAGPLDAWLIHISMRKREKKGRSEGSLCSAFQFSRLGASSRSQLFDRPAVFPTSPQLSRKLAQSARVSLVLSFALVGLDSRYRCRPWPRD